MSWPNNPEWNALQKKIVPTDEGTYKLSTIDCGMLKVPSGKLICCDPFAGMRKTGNSYIEIPKGQYPVVVTLADVSNENDGSHIREAYASLIIDKNSTEVKRKLFHPTEKGNIEDSDLREDDYFGFPVDAGTACFVDQESIDEGMPLEDTWYEGLFENDDEKSWFNLMDDENHIRNGIANIVLPESKCDNNLILFHSGWGDGVYPVIGGYDNQNNLVAIHIDFMVMANPVEKNTKEVNIVAPYKESVKNLDYSNTEKPWWKFW